MLKDPKLSKDEVEERWEKLSDKQKKKYVTLHNKKKAEYVTEFETFVRVRYYCSICYTYLS